MTVLSPAEREQRVAAMIAVRGSADEEFVLQTTVSPNLPDARRRLDRWVEACTSFVPEGVTVHRVSADRPEDKLTAYVRWDLTVTSVDAYRTARDSIAQAGLAACVEAHRDSAGV